MKDKEEDLLPDDPIEREVALALQSAGIGFVTEKQGAILDFYLPEYKTHIECKAYHTDRVSKQLQDTHEVILIQSSQAAKCFSDLIQSTQLQEEVSQLKAQNQKLKEVLIEVKQSILEHGGSGMQALQIIETLLADTE